MGVSGLLPNMLKMLFPFVFLVGTIILYYGIKKAKRLIFPDFREDFFLSQEKITIYFPEIGKYQFFYCRKPKFKIIRKPIPFRGFEFKVTHTFSGEEIPYTADFISFFTRSDLKAVRAHSLGEINIPKVGKYDISYSAFVGEPDDFLSVMSYHGGVLDTFFMVWTILIGSFMTLGGLIMSMVVWQGRL